MNELTLHQLSRGPISQMVPRPAEGDSWGPGWPPRPALGPAHCTPVQVPPLIQAPLLGGALRDLSLAGLFLELLMALFAFPMTSNVPLPRTPPPCRVPSSPSPALSRRRGGPLGTSVSLPWFTLLCAHGRGRWSWMRWSGGTQRPQVSWGLGVGEGKPSRPPAPESALPPSQAREWA